MLSIFRTNQLLGSVLLIGYVLLLHVGYWLVPPPPAPPTHGIGAHAVAGWLATHPVWVPVVVIGLLFVQGVLANVLTFEHRIAPEVNLFSGVLVVFLGSSLPAFLPFSGWHVANVFLLLTMLALLRVYRVQSAADHIFNAGFWLGIATLFQVHYLFFLLATSMSLTLLRKSSLREQLMLLTGCFIPWLFVGFGYFWFDQFDHFWTQQWKGAFNWFSPLNLATLPIAALVGWAVLMLVALLSYSRYNFKTTMEVRKKIDLLFWFFLAGSLAGLSAQPWQLGSLLALAPSLGILLGLNLTYLSARAAEFWHLLLVLALLALQLLPLYPMG